MGNAGQEGQGILDAATPIFNRNLQQSADVLRQSGPRFASNTERLVGDQNQKALQDFNLFSQNVLESGRNRFLNTVNSAGQFANQQQGLQNAFNGPLIQQLLGAGFTAGGLNQQPTVIEKKPWWQQGLGAISSIVNIAGQAKNLSGGGSYSGEGALTGDSGPYGGAGGAGGGGGIVGGGGYGNYGSAPAPNMQMSGMMGGTAPMPGWNRQTQTIGTPDLWRKFMGYS